MAFLVAPAGDFDRAVHVGVAVQHARGFQGVDDAEGTIEPAGMVLALQMRAGEQLESGLPAGTQHVADAVDRRRQSRLGQLLRQPFDRAQVRHGKGRLVHAALVRADGAQRVEVGKDALAVGFQGRVGHRAVRHWE